MVVPMHTPTRSAAELFARLFFSLSALYPDIGRTFQWSWIAEVYINKLVTGEMRFCNGDPSHGFGLIWTAASAGEDFGGGDNHQQKN